MTFDGRSYTVAKDGAYRLSPPDMAATSWATVDSPDKRVPVRVP
jgi:hypothetical protein